jgi:hypothetical protein
MSTPTNTDPAQYLGELPAHLHSRNSGAFLPLYTADQMRAYALDAVQRALAAQQPLTPRSGCGHLQSVAYWPALAAHGS